MFSLQTLQNDILELRMVTANKLAENQYSYNQNIVIIEVEKITICIWRKNCGKNQEWNNCFWFGGLKGYWIWNKWHIFKKKTKEFNLLRHKIEKDFFEFRLNRQQLKLFVKLTYFHMFIFFLIFKHKALLIVNQSYPPTAWPIHSLKKVLKPEKGDICHDSKLIAIIFHCYTVLTMKT
jgi:hypothetical protein